MCQTSLYWYWYWYWIACPFFFGSCKVQTGSVRIGGPRLDNQWRYLSKFGYMEGVSTYSIRLKLVQPSTISSTVKLGVELFLDEEWDQAESSPTCNRSHLSRAKLEVDLDHTGQWGPWLNGTVKQSIRPHVWYFVLNECHHKLQNFTHRIRFETRMFQPDGSHFSIELRGMLSLHLVMLAIFTALMVKYIAVCRQFIKSAESLHPVLWVLSGAMILQYIGELFRVGNLWVYNSNGVGVKALDVLSEILFTLSQVTVASLLILIALGYTLVQSKIGDLDLMIPVTFMISIMHVMLVGFGKIRDDAAYKFHENEGVVGWVLLLMRALLYAWFVWAVKSTGAEAGMKLQSFLRKFLAAGTLYFLWHPLAFMVVGVFAPYLRHKFMTATVLVCQVTCNLWLASLFLGRGEYFKVSTLNSSFLPGGVKCGMDKEE